VASNDMMFILSFINVSHLVQKLFLLEVRWAHIQNDDTISLFMPFNITNV
jgi:hypothetical protein